MRLAANDVDALPLRSAEQHGVERGPVDVPAGPVGTDHERVHSSRVAPPRRLVAIRRQMGTAREVVENAELRQQWGNGRRQRLTALRGRATDAFGDGHAETAAREPNG